MRSIKFINHILNFELYVYKRTRFVSIIKVNNDREHLATMCVPRYQIINFQISFTEEAICNDSVYYIAYTVCKIVVTSFQPCSRR